MAEKCKSKHNFEVVWKESILSVLMKITVFKDNFSAPIVQTRRSLIRDTWDCHRKLQRKIMVQKIMDISYEQMPIIPDVKSLYANILHDKGTVAVLCLLHKAPP